MTSTRQQGNAIENRLALALRAHGYTVFISRGSRGLDLFAIHPDDEKNHPHIAAEVGTKRKSIGASLRELYEYRLPAGTIRIVARYIRHKGERPYFKLSTGDGTYTNVKDLLRR